MEIPSVCAGIWEELEGESEVWGRGGLNINCVPLMDQVLFYILSHCSLMTFLKGRYHLLHFT